MHNAQTARRRCETRGGTGRGRLNPDDPDSPMGDCPHCYANWRLPHDYGQPRRRWNRDPTSASRATSLGFASSRWARR